MEVQACSPSTCAACARRLRRTLSGSCVSTSRRSTRRAWATCATSAASSVRWRSTKPCCTAGCVTPRSSPTTRCWTGRSSATPWCASPTATTASAPTPTPQQTQATTSLGRASCPACLRNPRWTLPISGWPCSSQGRSLPHRPTPAPRWPRRLRQRSPPCRVPRLSRRRSLWTTVSL